MTRTTLRHTWVVGACIAAIGFLFLIVTGVAPAQAIFLTAIVCVQVASGTWFWVLARRGQASAVEALGMGSAIGVIAALLSGLLVQALGAGNWGWALPSLVTLISWLVLRRSTKNATHKTNAADASEMDSGTRWALIITAVTGLLSLIPNIASYPLSWVGVGGKYHADMLFFEALSTSISKFGVNGSIFSPGDSIHYHWLVYAWTGQISNAANADPFVALTRVLPFLAITSACLIAIAWVKRLTTVVWAPTLAVVLLILGGYIGATYGAIFNFDSPSQSITAAWILAFSYACVLLLQSESPLRAPLIAQIVAVCLLMFGLAGGKISAGVIALAAILFATAVAIVRKEAWTRIAILISLLSILIFAVTYLVIVSCSADPGGLKFLSILDRASSVQGLNPLAGSIGIIAGTAILALAIVARWSGLVWFWAQPKSRWNPATVLGTGLAIGGIVALLALSSGLNETWFALAASAPLIAISAAGTGEAAKALGIESFKKSRILFILIAAAAVLFIAVTALWMTGASGGDAWVSTLRWLAPLTGVVGALVIAVVIAKSTKRNLSTGKSILGFTIIILVLLSAPGRLLGFGSGQVGMQPGLSNEAFGPIVPFVTSIDQVGMPTWSDQHVEAANWLRMNARSDDLVATNITLGAFVPALTQLPTFASALGYQGIYGPSNMVQPLIDREAQSWNFINSPSPQTFKPLCDAKVTWIWVDPVRTGLRSWNPFASPAYANDSAIVLRLNAQTCSAL